MSQCDIISFLGEKKLRGHDLETVRSEGASTGWCRTGRGAVRGGERTGRPSARMRDRAPPVQGWRLGWRRKWQVACSRGRRWSWSEQSSAGSVPTGTGWPLSSSRGALPPTSSTPPRCRPTPTATSPSSAPTTTRAQLLRIRGRLAEMLAAAHLPPRRPDEVLRTLQLLAKQFMTAPGPLRRTVCRHVAQLGHHVLSLARPAGLLDLKFVVRMQRPFQFSADSFGLVLDSVSTMPSCRRCHRYR